jgi:hypothetical protein
MGRSLETAANILAYVEDFSIASTSKRKVCSVATPSITEEDKMQPLGTPVVLPERRLESWIDRGHFLFEQPRIGGHVMKEVGVLILKNSRAEPRKPAVWKFAIHSV